MVPDDRKRVGGDVLDIQLDELLSRERPGGGVDDLYDGEW